MTFAFLGKLASAGLVNRELSDYIAAVTGSVRSAALSLRRKLNTYRRLARKKYILYFVRDQWDDLSLPETTTLSSQYYPPLFCN